MTRDEAKKEAKGRIEEYLESKGINTRKPFPCFNPKHADKNPSMSFDRRHNRVKCFACGESYDIFDLVGLEYGLEGKAKFDKAFALLGIQVDGTPRRNGKQETKAEEQHTHTDTDTDVYTHKPEADYTAYFRECKSRIAETEYHRGLSAGTLERHYIGYEPNFRTTNQPSGEYVSWQALIIPTGKGSYKARNTDKNATKKNRYRIRGNAQVFNAKAMQTAKKPIIIVEGEIDAMSIEEAGGCAVGLGSLDNVPLFLRMLEVKKPPQPFIIALDAEAEPEIQKTVEAKEAQLMEGLERLSIPYYRLRPFAGYHDANEALMRDREAFVEAVTAAENIEAQAEEAEKEAYLNTTAGANLQQFINGITESVNTPCISTGFSTLDSVLDGGLYEGLITIGAISSLGKTSFILQIADQVAEAGNDVLIFSLEMARAELMSKSISRHTLQLAMDRKMDTRNAKTGRGITDGKRYINYSSAENALIQDAISAYSKYADRVFIQEGIGNIGTEQIRQTVEKHIHITGRRPLVIVDYLQIMAPYSERMNDKQNTDKAVLELKRISRDLKLPVIAVSSFNRSNYNSEVAFEGFKESGAIEYGSDIVVGLQLKGAGDKNFDATAEKKKNPREVELVILKNRQGQVGDKIVLKYYPMFSYFIETGTR